MWRGRVFLAGGVGFMILEIRELIEIDRRASTVRQGLPPSVTLCTWGLYEELKLERGTEEMYMYLVDGCLSFGNADGVSADSRGSRRSVRETGASEVGYLEKKSTLVVRGHQLTPEVA
ncbi:hypothetical protein Agabi119p4_2529 [Agaricus bisporus var. burnettii]|uniref:Uncharacterized protein n=1 Tax=Agaricus bisporus var. burnettii TaxID=192524 RepID=A0A8H7KKC8_AGABI|nr:hypothetical protein Agabi119p4_2529 [Agaricus bisporus var. burnettii]